MAYSLLARLVTTASLLFLPVLSAGTASYNGLALTPQMGWDNWNAFGCKINEELLLSTAQKIVEFGLKDLGESVSNPSVYCPGSKRDAYGELWTRILLHHSRRLLVRRQNTEWHAQSQCYRFPQWDTVHCGPAAWHGTWLWDVLERWKIHMRAVRSELGDGEAGCADLCRLGRR